MDKPIYTLKKWYELLDKKTQTQLFEPQAILRDWRRDREILKARIADLTNELEGVNASHEDEVAAHVETLRMLGISKTRIAELGDKIIIFENTLDFSSKGICIRVDEAIQRRLEISRLTEQNKILDEGLERIEAKSDTLMGAILISKLARQAAKEVE